MLPIVLGGTPGATSSLEQATLLIALLLVAALIQKELGDHFTQRPMRRLSLALRAAALPLVLVFFVNAALMVMAVLQ